MLEVVIEAVYVLLLLLQYYLNQKQNFVVEIAQTSLDTTHTQKLRAGELIPQQQR